MDKKIQYQLNLYGRGILVYVLWAVIGYIVQLLVTIPMMLFKAFGGVLDEKIILFLTCFIPPAIAFGASRESERIRKSIGLTGSLVLTIIYALTLFLILAFPVLQSEKEFKEAYEKKQSQLEQYREDAKNLEIEIVKYTLTETESPFEINRSYKVGTILRTSKRVDPEIFSTVISFEFADGEKEAPLTCHIVSVKAKKDDRFDIYREVGALSEIEYSEYLSDERYFDIDINFASYCDLSEAATDLVGVNLKVFLINKNGGKVLLTEDQIDEIQSFSRILEF